MSIKFTLLVKILEPLKKHLLHKNRDFSRILRTSLHLMAKKDKGFVKKNRAQKAFLRCAQKASEIVTIRKQSHQQLNHLVQIVKLSGNAHATSDSESDLSSDSD